MVYMRAPDAPMEYLIGETVAERWTRHLPTPTKVLDRVWLKWHFLPGQVSWQLRKDVTATHEHVNWLYNTFVAWSHEWVPKCRQYMIDNRQAVEHAAHEYAREHHHHSAAVMAGPAETLTTGFLHEPITDQIHQCWVQMNLIDRQLSYAIMVMKFAVLADFAPPRRRVDDFDHEEKITYKLRSNEDTQQVVTVLNTILEVGGFLVDDMTTVSSLEEEFSKVWSAQ